MTTAPPPSAATARPLSHAQRLLWAAQQLHPAAPVHEMAFTVVVEHDLDPERFQQAFERLVAEADSLRTTIHEDRGEPVQHVGRPHLAAVQRLDLSAADDPVAAFRAWGTQRCQRRLDLRTQSYDVALADLGDGRTGWYLCQHHLLTDAWSFTVLFERLAELYEDLDAPGPLPAAVPPRAPTQAAERSPTPGTDHPLALYGGRQSRTGSTAAARRLVDIDDGTLADLDGLAGTPPLRGLTADLGRFRAHTAALVAYLHRVSGQSVVELGIPLLNRPTPRAKRTPGLATEVFPLRLELDEDETFATLFQKVTTATHELFAAARPGTSSADRNRNLSVTLNYLPASVGAFAGHPTHVTWLFSGHVEADHQVRLHVVDWHGSGTPEVLLDCNEDAFETATRQRAATHLRHVMEAMVRDPQQPIATVSLPDDDERAAVARHAVGPRAAARPLVTTSFDEVLAAHPDDDALTHGGQRWTYADLDDATRRIASVVAPGQRVAVAIDRTAAAVIAVLGTLRAGATFIPVDPTWPTDRTADVLADAEPDHVLVDGPDTRVSPDVEVTDVAELLQAAPVEGPLPSVGPDDLAYVLFTSGSTGRPKGVAVHHGALATYLTWARDTYDGGRRLRFPLFTPLTFDLTLTSLLVPLTAGGHCTVFPRRDERVDTAVRQVVADPSIDVVKLTPSHLSLVRDMDLQHSRIGQLILGGEDLTVAAAAQAVEQFGDDVIVHNEYGPTEATVGCVVAVFDAATDTHGSVPIGRPIPESSAWVLDEGGAPVPFGVPGELWIGGDGVAQGYVGRPELTAARFRALPHLGSGRYYRTGDLARMRPDGTIEYLGRTDDQVKIRGARVELGEVEARLSAHPRVAAVVATAHRRRQAGPSDTTQHCSRCGVPSDVPGIGFDEDGVCSECRAFAGYRDEAAVYFDTLDELNVLLRDARARTRSEYDCIALLSGGKDSTYALARIVDLGARPLAYTLDNGYISDDAKRNIRRVTEALGVDHVFGSTPSMNEIFVDSLQRHANVCHGCFKTIYTLSTTLALEQGIPMIVTGLSRGQFFETRLTRELFEDGSITPEQIDAEVLQARRAYHRVDDAPRRLLDTSALDREDAFEQVQYVDFYRYTDVSLDDMLRYLDRRLPWVRPSDTGRSTNCTINDVGIYVHTRQRGYHNYAIPYAWDVRLGHKERDAAMAELDDDIDPAYVQRVLEEIGHPTDVTAVTGDQRLVAYYVPDGEVSATELRRHAEQALPASMVPSQFVEVAEVPLTRNGKVDRDALPTPDTARPELDTTFIAPLTDRQTTIAAVWSDVLDVTPVGIRDDFFDLGGDSIMAIRITARCAAAGIEFELRDLFDNPTVEQLAAAAAAVAVTPPGEEPPRRATGPSSGDLDRLAALLQRREPNP